MTAGTSVVKLTARTTLKNNWLKVIVACTAVLFAYFICANAAGFVGLISNNTAAYIVLGILAVFILGPLGLGLLKFIWRFIFEADDRPVMIFSYFSGLKEYRRALRLISAILLRGAAFGLLLFLPAIIVDIFADVRIYDLLNIPTPLWTSNLFYLSVFLKTVATVLLCFIMLKYYFAPFLVIADENMEIGEAVHMSCMLSRKTMLDFIYLFFSFFGWFLLSVMVFPLLYVMPYYLVSLSVHVRFAIAEYNKHVELINSSAFPSFVAGI